MKSGRVVSFYLMCVFFFPVVAPEPECPGPATHFGAQQRDGDGGGEEVPQPQLPQPLPQLEHRRQVRPAGCNPRMGFLPRVAASLITIASNCSFRAQNNTFLSFCWRLLDVKTSQRHLFTQ